MKHYRMKHARRTSPRRILIEILLTAAGLLLIAAGAYALARLIAAPRSVTAPVVRSVPMLVREIEPTAPVIQSATIAVQEIEPTCPPYHPDETLPDEALVPN